MYVTDFMKIIDADFYTGVPDSQLKGLCDYVMLKYGTDPSHHIVAANEGNAVGIASGYHLTTGKVPVVYMQNSGEGNALNPIVSLLNNQVYGIPVLFVIGWRGEPGVHDEPQHVCQGQITTTLLDDLDIAWFVLDTTTSIDDVDGAMRKFKQLFHEGKSCAFVVRKGGLSSTEKPDYSNNYTLAREDAISIILQFAGSSPIVSTTGKPSRELFEIRDWNNESHSSDFLCVGSMGHASSIALGIATQKPHQTVWCIDGDGAVLMHMGALAVVGSSGLKNIVHIVLDNGSHETVGGVPTAARSANFADVALACGYDEAVQVSNEEELFGALSRACELNGKVLSMIVVKCKLGSRSDLGRPTISPEDSKKAFMDYLDDLG